MPKIPIKKETFNESQNVGRDSASEEKGLQPFIFHGVDLTKRVDSGSGGNQAVGECPFCGKSDKFYVNCESGQWQCFSCALKGNIPSFLSQLWETSRGDGEEFSDLKTDRGLLRVETLQEWGVKKSLITGEWLVPGYNHDKKLIQLYVYREIGGHKRLIPTKGLSHAIHGVNLYDSKKPTLYVTEGAWDGMILWETLKLAKTKNANVLAVPSANVFRESWLPLLKGKIVCLMYDSDHPRKREDGKTVAPVGFSAVKNLTGMLMTSDSKPKEVRYLKWGENGYDPDNPSGYDVRDYLKALKGPVERVLGLSPLLRKIEIAPGQWVESFLQKRSKEVKSLTPLECTSWSVLVDAWKEALEWIEGLDRGLSVMLASIASVRMPGDQLWVKIISPAASGKTTLCMALSVARKYVIKKSVIRGLYSGYQTDKEGTEDQSLLSKLRDKTLLVKDGDTLLKSPNLAQILSQLRDAYDTSSSTSYGNLMSRDYEGLRMTLILCGTESLRELDSTELGERFLDCVMMEEIDDRIEDSIGLRAIKRIIEGRAIEANGKVKDHQDESMTRAMRLTAGYVIYLRENSSRLLQSVEVSDQNISSIMGLGKFVAYMRAKPSEKGDKAATREMSTRLRVQLSRLALCLAVVLGTNKVDGEVLRRVRKVGLDTARGKTLELSKHLYRVGKKGASTAALAVWLGEPEEKIRNLLRFLRKLKVVELFTTQSGKSTYSRWRLSERIMKLYKEVMEEGDKETTNA